MASVQSFLAGGELAGSIQLISQSRLFKSWPDKIRKRNEVSDRIKLFTFCSCIARAMRIACVRRGTNTQKLKTKCRLTLHQTK
jgi:hypothetical protein